MQQSNKMQANEQFEKAMAQCNMSPENLEILKEVALKIKTKQATKILVMTGAGISTSCGIPDFRTKGTGLYDNLQKYNLDRPEDIFDLDCFMEDPEPFFTLSKEIYPGNFSPSFTHYFIYMLYKKGQLLRNYTQNIDGLEYSAGIKAEMLVEAHGNFRTSSCILCKKKITTEPTVKDHIMRGTIPNCPDCEGVFKPDITFFGERLPERFYNLSPGDFEQCDMLLVLGTSLKVMPFRGLVNLVDSDVPSVLINNEDSFKNLNGPPKPSIRVKSIQDVNEDDVLDSLAKSLAFSDPITHYKSDFDASDSDEEIEVTVVDHSQPSILKLKFSSSDSEFDYIDVESLKSPKTDSNHLIEKTYNRKVALCQCDDACRVLADLLGWTETIEALLMSSPSVDLKPSSKIKTDVELVHYPKKLSR